VNVEGRERFFRAIAERIDADRVEEVHVFPAIRQGGRESGVAVVTLRPAPFENEQAEGEPLESELIESGLLESEAAEGEPLEDDLSEGAESGSEPAGSTAPEEEIAENALSDGEIPGGDVTPPSAPVPRRFTVLRAHYRLQLKGPDRGKWEVGVVEEADAPAATVDEVVRGVHERAGGWSVEGPEHLTGDEFRAALVEEPWSATR
jgi:hypothetical protein